MHTKCLMKCVTEKYHTCVSPVIFEGELYMCIITSDICFDADLNETCAKKSLIKRKNQQQVQLSLKKAQHLHKQIEEA